MLFGFGRESLMTIEAAQLEVFAVEKEAVGRKPRFTKAYPRLVVVNDALIFKQADADLIKLRAVNVP